MKYIKQYDHLDTMPNENDYIIVDVNVNVNNKDVSIFLNTNIGQVISTNNKKIYVAYNNIPPDIRCYFYYSDKRKTFYTDYIFGFTKFISSNSKEELEEIIQTNKYNL